MARLASVLAVLGLLVATAAGGYLRASHAMAVAGLEHVVICGEDGTRVVTLDRHGRPMDPSEVRCGHCGDCDRAPILALAGHLPLPAPEVASSTPRPGLHPPPRFIRPIESPSRGPPTGKAT
jgi:hypothetical protein